jgi:DNA-binding NarL/FixJ family response regulator
MHLRLLVADDHEVVRKGLYTLLSAQPGWEIAAQARDGREAVKLAKECKPDVAVLDVSMPDLNGLEAARKINKEVSSTKVLLLTMHESDQLISEALEAGVRGFLLKSDAGKDLVGAVDALGKNQTFFTSGVTQLIFDGYLKAGPRSSISSENGSRSRLTGRQREIVQLLGEGKSNKEVASMLNVSVKTAETHRANIMRRLNCHCVADLVLYAIRNQIVQP